MVEKQLIKLSKSPAIGSEYEIKNATASVIEDALVVTIYNLVASAGKANKGGMTSLLQLNLFDVRQTEETDSHDVFWPYAIKSLAINPIKKSILIISQSLEDE